jgi:hypothetical protein
MPELYWKVLFAFLKPHFAVQTKNTVISANYSKDITPTFPFNCSSCPLSLISPISTNFRHVRRISTKELKKEHHNEAI